MLDSLSGELQLILMIVGIAILFALVSWNNKRNKNKLYHRNKRDFKQNYLAKKREQNNENIH